MDQQEVLAARYGRTRRGKRRELIFGILVAFVASVAFLVWSIFVVQTNATSPSPNTLSYRVLSPLQTEITFSVTNANGRAISCDLQALNSKYEIVGERMVDYPVGTTQQTSLLNTVTEAVTGVAKTCSVK